MMRMFTLKKGGYCRETASCRESVCGITAISIMMICTGIFSGCTQKDEESEPPETYEIEKHYKRGPVAFFLRVSKKEITIAERIRMELEIRASEEYEAELPDFGEKLEQFGIVDYSAPPEKLGPNSVVIKKKEYLLEPFLSGEYTIPRMKVVFRKKDAKKKNEHHLESEKLTVKVTSLLPEKMEQLAVKDEIAPAALPRKRTPALWWVIGSVGAAVCAGAVLLVLFRRGESGSGTVMHKPAHEAAYDRLRRLVSQDLVKQGRIKEFYTGLSDILRIYIENRFGLHAPERTTEEFLEELGSGDMLENGHKSLLRDFLVHCDMVKFAEYQPDSGQIQTTFDACKRFISETEQQDESSVSAGDTSLKKAAGNEV